MKTKIILALLVSVFACQIMEAQIIDRISRDIKRQVQRKVERGVERSVDDALDDAEDQIKGKGKRSKKNKKDKYSVPETEVVVVKEIKPYSFTGDLVIDVESNGWMEDNMIMVVVDKFEVAVRPMLVKSPNNLMVYDKESESVVKINKDKYNGQALKDFYNYEKADDDVEFEKTSDIEDIHGFVARKYVLDGDGFKGEAWISPEIDLDYDLIQSLMEHKYLGLGTQYGFPLKMNIEFNNGDTMNFEVQQIDIDDPDVDVLDVSEYELIDMTDLKSGN